MNKPTAKNLTFRQQKALSNLITLLFILVITFPFWSILRTAINDPQIIKNLQPNPQLNPGKVAEIIVDFLRVLSCYVIAFWFFLNEPRWFIARYNLHPFEEDNNEVQQRIRGWVEAAVSKSVNILLIPGEQAHAFTFGSWRHAYLAISKGTFKYLQEEQLKALVFHELSHIVNEDLWKTKLARNITVTTLVVQLIPEIIGLPQEYLMRSSGAFWPLILMIIGAAFYFVMWIGVAEMMRMGELLADQYAIQKLEGPEPLIRLFYSTRLIKDQFTDWIGHKSRWLPEILQMHPRPNKRLRFAMKPSSFLEENYFFAIYSGFIISLALALMGDTQISINYALPLVITFGSFVTLFLYAVVSVFTRSFRKELTENIKIILALTSTAAITSTMIPACWGALQISNPLDYASTIFIATKKIIYLTPRLKIMHNLGLASDLQVILTLIPSFFFLLLFLFAFIWLRRLSQNKNPNSFKRILVAWLFMVLPVCLITSIWWYRIINGNIKASLHLAAGTVGVLVWLIVIYCSTLILIHIKESSAF